MDKGRTEVEAAKRARIQESLLVARSFVRKGSMLKQLSSRLRSHAILDVRFDGFGELKRIRRHYHFIWVELRCHRNFPFHFQILKEYM